MLSDKTYKDQAVKLGAALSPWKEMKDPVTRLASLVVTRNQDFILKLLNSKIYFKGCLVGGADPEQPRGLAAGPVLSEVSGGHSGKIILEFLI